MANCEQTLNSIYEQTKKINNIYGYTSNLLNLIPDMREVNTYAENTNYKISTISNDFPTLISNVDDIKSKVSNYINRTASMTYEISNINKRTTNFVNNFSALSKEIALIKSNTDLKTVKDNLSAIDTNLTSSLKGSIRYEANRASTYSVLSHSYAQNNNVRIIAIEKYLVSIDAKLNKIDNTVSGLRNTNLSSLTTSINQIKSSLNRLENTDLTPIISSIDEIKTFLGLKL